LETESVDVIVGKESWLHIKNKAFFFKEIYRALKPGGIFVCVDWMHRNASYSNLMKQFVFMDGLTFNLCTIKAYLQYMSRDILNGPLIKDCDILNGPPLRQADWSTLIR
jgi:SAM-dependent methyltransferase